MENMTDNTDLSKLTFKDLNVCDELVEACEKLGYKHPTKIQAESIPFSINGRDIIGLAETGSGKTAAFAIPIIQTLLKDPQPFFALVMAPTRELCIQISEQFEALGAGIGLKTAVLVGGLDMVQQAVALSKKPHIIVGTPGRLADHLSNTKGFSLKYLKYLVFDEADRLLNLDFEKQITQILSVIPKKRNTFLFSATMTSKVQKLERASLNDPVKIEVNSKYQTVGTLIQNYVFIPAKYKDCYMVYLLTEFSGNKMIVFSTTCANSARLTIILRNLGFKAVGINGQMSQNQRISALNKFKANERNILIATDVAARGLDIPLVDLVINFDLPQNPKNYVHRVGRTARAGNAGRSVSFVTQYDVENFQKIEHLIGLKMDSYDLSEENVLVLHDRVVEAQRLANMEMKNKERGKKGLVGIDDEEEGAENGSGKVLNKRKANFDSKSFARKKKKN